MGKLITLCIAAMMAVGAMAEGHLKFKGVEINGTEAQFVSQLSKHGCEAGVNGIGVDLIKADFAGVAMLVKPLTTSQTKTMYAVAASTRKIEDEASLQAQYNSLNRLMKDKYGNGEKVVLEDGYYTNSIGVFERGNTSDAVRYMAPDGMIFLYMHKDRYSGSHVVVEYWDTENNILKGKEANQDI